MEPTAAEHHEPGGRRRRVLLVQDDFLKRWDIAEYLRETGFEVVEAVSADEAMTLLAADSLIHAVLYQSHAATDSVSSKFSEWLARTHPSIPMLLTAEKDDGTAPSATAHAAQRQFIANPKTAAEIAQAIEQLMAVQ